MDYIINNSESVISATENLCLQFF